jgi:hypothetical protein
MGATVPITLLLFNVLAGRLKLDPQAYGERNANLE